MSKILYWCSKKDDDERFSKGCLERIYFFFEAEEQRLLRRKNKSL